MERCRDSQTDPYYSITSRRRIIPVNDCFRIALITGLLSYWFACEPMNANVLQLKDVQGLSVTWSKEKRVLSVKGLAFHSALAVESMRIERKGNRLLILLYLVPARRGLSGSFEYEVPVPVDVREVLFGSKAESIWRESP
jgi:hypothetical protein